MSSDAIAIALKAAGFAVDAVGNALKDIFNLADSAVAEILGTIGFAAQAIAEFFGDVWDSIKDGSCGIFGC